MIRRQLPKPRKSVPKRLRTPLMPPKIKPRQPDGLSSPLIGHGWLLPLISLNHSSLCQVVPPVMGLVSCQWVSVFPIGRGSSPIQEQRRLRERARDVRARLANVPDHVGEFGSVLFPNSQLVFDQQLSIESRQLERSFGAPDKFIPVVVGLVDYTFSLSTAKRETGFITYTF